MLSSVICYPFYYSRGSSQGFLLLCELNSLSSFPPAVFRLQETHFTVLCPRTYGATDPSIWAKTRRSLSEGFLLLLLNVFFHHKNVSCNFRGLGYVPRRPGGNPGGLSNAKFLPLTLVLGGAELLPSGFSGNYGSSFCCHWGCGVWTRVAVCIEWEGAGMPGILNCT